MSTTTHKKPRVSSSAEWLESIRARYEVGPDGEVLLEQAARTLDVIADIEARLQEDGLTLPARGGGVRAHPLVRVLTDQRSLFLRYVRELGLGK